MGPVLRRRFDSFAEALPTEDVGDQNTHEFPVDVTDVNLIDGRPYKAQSLTIGGRAYEDRQYQWKSLPEGMEGHTMIQPRNGDQETSVPKATRFYRSRSVNMRKSMSPTTNGSLISRNGYPIFSRPI